MARSVADMATPDYPPSPLAPDARAALLAHIADGGTIASYARMPQAATASQVRRAMQADPQLAADFAEARKAGAEAIADDARDIADTPSDHPDDVAHRRLRIDVRRWLAKAWNPATYGDSSRVTHAGDAGAPIAITDAERAQRIAAILAAAQGPGKARDGDGAAS